MSVKMIAGDPAKPVHVIHHWNRAYVVGHDGVFDINDADVLDMSKHGLITKKEADGRAYLATILDPINPSGSNA